MKKILSLILALALSLGVCVSFASCGEESGPLPIVCGENGMNDICGIATYGVDYYSLGVAAGDMAADILLDGKKPSEIPVKTDPNPTLTVNKTAADELGITIPQSIIDRAGTKQNNEVTRVESVIVESGADYTVGILQLMQHVALDQANDGFVDQLSVRFNAAGKTLTVLNKNAGGDEANNTTIVANFTSNNVDLIYTIATSSSQAAVSGTEENQIPVIFNAVTDPVGAGLVKSMSDPSGNKNVTGISDINPVDKQIELIAELLGKEEIKIGFLYTAAETNSVFQIRDLAIPYCNEKGYTYVDKGISDINDLRYAFVTLQKENVDAIYIPTDNVIANACATVHSINKGE
jgi:ABC-type uncharacterized transport system substrate-binding protein